jgi:transaldolase
MSTTGTTGDPLADLTASGVSVWLDDLSRGRLATGNLQALVRDRSVVGVTTNPTIFRNAITDGAAYVDQVADLARRGVLVEEAVRMLTTFDVRWACDVLRPVYDATDGVDGRVSIEVDRGSPTTRAGQQPRPVPCGGSSTGPTCSSRSPRPGKGSRRSPRPWRRESAST